MNPEDTPPEPPEEVARQPIFHPRAFEAAPVVALVAAMIAIHGWIAWGGVRAANEVYTRYAFISERFWRGESYETLLSYSMLHGDWIHLGMNGVALFALGGACWRLMGTARFFVFFALTAIGGALLFGLLRPDETGPVVGASGAIFGLIAAIKRAEFRIRSLGGEEMTVAILRFMGLIILLNVAIGVATGGLMAWEAHIGGFIVGWAVTPWLVRIWPS